MFNLSSNYFIIMLKFICKLLLLTGMLEIIKKNGIKQALEG